jgi:predicted nucleic acid-binding protein
VTRFVIDSSTTLHLASERTQVPAEHELLAPTLWRSQVLAAIYGAVRRGEITGDVAEERLAYVNGLKIRLLGDAVLRRVAWRVAEQLDLDTTFEAEYIALTKLQADALVTLDADLARRAQAIVPTATIDALLTA